LRAKEPATLIVPPPAPAVAFAAKSSRPSPPDVTSAFTVVGPFAVPATVAELFTFARLIAIAAPIAAGGARAAVAVPSALAFASVCADDQRVRLLAPTVTPVGSAALDVVFETFAAIAAATLIVPPDVCDAGVAGKLPVPVVPLFDATLLPKVRLADDCASVVETFEIASARTGVTAVPPAAPPVAVVVNVFALVASRFTSPAVTLAPSPIVASVVALATWIAIAAPMPTFAPPPSCVGFASVLLLR